MSVIAHVLFRAGGLDLATPVHAVHSIHESLEIQPVNGTIDWFLGLAVTQGHLLPVSDLGAFLSAKPALGRTLQINADIGISGLRIDEVVGISSDLTTALDGSAEDQPDLGLLPFAIASDDAQHQILDIALLLQSPRFLAIESPNQ